MQPNTLMDLGGGVMAWLALRDGQATSDMTEVQEPTESQSASEVESSPVHAEPGAVATAAATTTNGKATFE